MAKKVDASEITHRKMNSRGAEDRFVGRLGAFSFLMLDQALFDECFAAVVLVFGGHGQDGVGVRESVEKDSRESGTLCGFAYLCTKLVTNCD
jgi:hypothetical protein